MNNPAKTVPFLLTQSLHSSLASDQHDRVTALLTTPLESVEAVLRAYTSLTQLGSHPLVIAADDQAALDKAVPGLAFDTWTCVDAARALLLIQIAETRGDAACVEAALACYEQGDAAEQQSWLRAVCVLPDPAQFTTLVVDACRTNILPVFQAVACGNPFPAAHLPERNFNQMVLKALFNGVPLARIHRLADRKNPELARMAGDYADERRAAGRTVPADIGLAL